MKLLDFDSSFWGISFYEINADEIKDISLESKNEKIFQVSLSEEKFQLYFNDLVNSKFFYGGSSLTFKKDVSSKTGYENKCSITTATKSDLDDICRIASKKFVCNSRYNVIFSKQKIMEFYSLWAKKSIEKTFDDTCLVYKNNNNICGFITLKLLPYERGSYCRIGLIAVDSNYSGNGIASELIKYASHFYQNKATLTIEATTQTSNLKAINLYIKNNFIVHDFKHWFYKKEL